MPLSLLWQLREGCEDAIKLLLELLDLRLGLLQDVRRRLGEG